jgi:hypothetical protein
MLFATLSALALALTPAQYTPSAPPATPLVRNYLALCADNGETCADILFDHAWSHSVGDQRVGYCLPQTGEDEATVTRKVVAWLTARPAMADQPTDPALNTALENLYPCR